MAGFTTAFPNSFKAELPQALHNFTQNTGHIFKVALGIGAATGTYGAGTANYSNLIGDEVPNGNGYVTGGFAFTAAQNLTPSLSGTTAFWSWSVNPAWPSATFTTSGCIFYNLNAGNRAVYVGSFGGAQTVSGATFTLVLPTNSAATSLLRLT